MNFRLVVDSLKRRSSRTPGLIAGPATARRRPARQRLQLEPLEDRSLPSAAIPYLAIGASDSMAGPSAGALASPEANGNVVSSFARDVHGVRVLWGESTNVDGARVATWALVSPHDEAIVAAGVTFSLKLAKDMPQEPGPGPAGAVASLDFPGAVQQATFFNHLEIQPEPHGHEAPPGSVNPDRNRVPHFDFHFYGVPEEQVWGIPDVRPPLPAVPADRLPAGYTQPGRSVLQMGRHSSPRWSLTDPNPLTTIMIAGYLPDGSQMHFLEPMISQQTLLGRQDFTLPVPVPGELGRASSTLYPTSFNALFQGNAYSFVFSDFVTVPAGASAADGAPVTQVAPPSSLVPELLQATSSPSPSGAPDGSSPSAALPAATAWDSPVAAPLPLGASASGSSDSQLLTTMPARPDPNAIDQLLAGLAGDETDAVLVL